MFCCFRGVPPPLPPLQKREICSLKTAFLTKRTPFFGQLFKGHNNFPLSYKPEFFYHYNSACSCVPHKGHSNFPLTYKPEFFNHYNSAGSCVPHKFFIFCFLANCSKATVIFHFHINLNFCNHYNSACSCVPHKFFTFLSC